MVTLILVETQTKFALPGGGPEGDVDEVLVEELVAVADDLHVVGGAAAAVHGQRHVRLEARLVPRVRHARARRDAGPQQLLVALRLEVRQLHLGEVVDPT